jgi:hypothetical protein
LRREFVAPSLMYVLYTSLGAPAHAAKFLAPEIKKAAQRTAFLKLD